MKQHSGTNSKTDNKDKDPVYLFCILAFVFLAIAVIADICLTNKQVIDADTAVSIPTFLITSMTIAFNIGIIWYTEGEKHVQILLFMALLFIAAAVGILIWLFVCKIHHVLFSDILKSLIIPISTFLAGVVFPLINTYMNPPTVYSINNSKTMRVAWTIVYIILLIINLVLFSLPLT